MLISWTIFVFIAAADTIRLSNEGIKSKTGEVRIPKGDVVTAIKIWEKNKDWFTRETNPFVRD